MRGSGLRTPAFELSITASNIAMIAGRTRGARLGAAAMLGPWPWAMLLVMQPTLKCCLHSFSASTIRGRTSPDSSGSTSAPRTGWPSAVDLLEELHVEAVAVDLGPLEQRPGVLAAGWWR